MKKQQSGSSLQTKSLSISFGGHTAVNAVSCQFHPNELTVIVGPNGAGKTTFFNLISGQLKPTHGQVILNNHDVSQMPPATRARLGIGRAFQLTNLFPRLSVLENIRLVVQAHSGDGWRFFTRITALPELEAKAEHFLHLVGLSSVAHMLANELSHGNQRKLEVAMLMAMEPDIYMFDEPTAGMSLDEAPSLLELIANLKNDSSKTVLLVEHKMSVVRALADRIIVLHNGEVLEDGTPDRIMTSKLVKDVYLGNAGGLA
ncbi:ABC transporter ATP-binding protein [Polycladidibacter stylochi]|uniref:ABC transporter ATP-binding protein n=1 Tax=Polycladidibacter stylochi TaxID=1807766 RepID=UPI000833A8C0|nr:ABC transporter ATP-binding protein [Pseudovibrio stylochi]